MRIRTNVPGVANTKAGFNASIPGEYDFPSDTKYQGWLNGQVARGNISLIARTDAYGPEALGLTSGSTAPEPADTSFAPGAEGLTSGSTSGEAPPDPSDPATFAPGAQGLTPGSTPGLAPEEEDLAKDLADASATQHPETAEKARRDAVHTPRRR